jgi:hypothetical protein
VSLSPNEALDERGHARVIKGDATMLISKEKLSAKAKTKLGLSTTVAAFWMAAIPFAGAAATSTQSTSRDRLT